ncbi:MAG TPA: PAS domain-containing protein [Longimicrobiaceae bacterium]|nr:PAS domain-containing protein [Longimicrobiaceae bacterium]
MLSSSPVLEAIQDGVYTIDAAGRITYWNAAAERILGISREDALGRPFREVLPRPDGADAWACVARVLEERVPLEYTETYGARGLPRHLAVRAAPVEGDGVLVHFRDATSERGVREQYARLLEAIRDGFIAVDSAWRIVYINRAAEQLLHLLRDRALGADLHALLPARPPEIVEALRATMADGEPRHLSAVKPEGRVFRDRVFDVWTYPLPLGGVSILFEDVSERVRREMDLARLAAEAEEANRAKSRFFTAVSHELRTPLNAIVGYTHLLSTETYGSVPAGAQRAAERAGVCAEHLARLVDDVLLMTTAEVGRLPVSPAPVELEPFLRGTLEPLRQQAEAKRLRFQVEVGDGAATLQTDPDRLRQLLLALVGNAVKFTPQGEVRIETRAVPEAPDVVEVWVGDTGPGISPEDRGRIFEAFEQLGDPSRTDSMRRGTGFGLTIARKLATLLRGSLRVDGRDGGGSVFILRLPRAFAPTSAGEGPAA